MCNNPLQYISFSFKDICGAAKDLKPDNWCIVATNQRLSFIEIVLPQFGPATLQRQLVVNNYMQIEAYIGSKKISEETLNTDDIKSVSMLKEFLNTFVSCGICMGNRNFHKESPTESAVFWRHDKCVLVYEKESFPRKQCCDMCLQLNSFLTKKQKRKGSRDISSETKKIKTESDEGEITIDIEELR